jgi:uncharacterized protein YndB with AHSA1/START domain
MFVAIVVATLVAMWASVLVYAATRPDTITFEGETTIKAPPETIFPLVSDFRNWPRWSPFEALDPAMKRAHSGLPGSRGTIYEWDGNRRAGKGRMEIFDVSPPKMVLISVDFFKPFEAHNVNLFAFAQEGDSTKVLWMIECGRPYKLKLLSVLVISDKLLGKHFEAGLANLKAAAEALV